ncbi:MAG: hypothetical protein ICV60_12135 [Pyrinomonadaceae bacterium]|nr:hypothetical protein [Pyrinomonadaceae bacterium]
MKFQYYSDELRDVPKLSVDGTVPNSIHFSHWQGNETPAAMKADTSTEIALNLVASPQRDELTRGIELVTNNHFDTDGVLSVWTMLQGERALGQREKLISAAEAGDFSEWTSDDGVRASIVIQGPDQPLPNENILSPLANQLAGRKVTDEAEAYELVLPEVERVLTRVDDYEPLWRAAWQRLQMAARSFERGESRVEEDTSAKLSVITLAPGAFGSDGFNPTEHTAPLTAIPRRARGQLFLIAMPARSGGWFYRIDYPYYSWAETVVRPPVARRNLSSVVAELNELEEQEGAGRWRLDKNELSSAIKFLDQSGALAVSKVTPDRVAQALRGALLDAEARIAETVANG